MRKLSFLIGPLFLTAISAFADNPKDCAAYWKDNINPYKNNSDISLVFVEMKKMTKKGSEKKATSGYAVNRKTGVFELFQFEVDGKPHSILLGLLELGIVSME